MRCKGNFKVAEEAEQKIKKQQNDFAIFDTPQNCNYIKKLMQIKLHHTLWAIVCVVFFNTASSQNFNWAYAAGGMGNDVGTSIATDANGNVYVSGNVSGGGYFGNQYVSGTVFEVFLAKYDAAGNVLWAKSYGGLKNEKAYSISITADAVYVCGYFEDTATFGNTTLVALGNYDVFVMKTDLNGNEIWTKQAGGLNDDIAFGITADANDNVYVCGIYKTKLTIGNLELQTTNPFTESFIFSLDKNGNTRWAKTSKGNNNNSAFGIAWNKHQAITVAGFLGSNFSLDSTTIVSQTSSYDAFVASFDLDGNLRWLSQTGSAAEDQAMAVTCDTAGNSYVTGYIGGTATIANTALPFYGWNDIFIAKLNNDGQFLWARHGGGAKLDLGTSITVDEESNVYIAGMFENSITFGSTQLTDADRGVFLASYTTDGNFRFAQAAGDVQTDAALGIAVKNSTAFITGYYLFKCKFGNFAMPYADFFNIFIAAYSVPKVLSVSDHLESDIRFFPNPASDVLYISTSETTQLSIIDIQGKELLNTTLTKGTQAVSTTALPAGILLLKFNSGNGLSGTAKLIKE